VNGEDSRSSVLLNGSSVTDYILRCCSGVQVNRQPEDGLSWCVWRVSDCKNVRDCRS
jgi:hypothetical protein